MHKVNLSGIEPATENGREILRMGGPWIGDVDSGDDAISKNSIVDNFICKEDTNFCIL